jgi:RNA polymerase sigma-70 factor (ECF subfamily)
VYAYARVALRDTHEAEDVTQLVFMRVLQAIGGYEVRPGKPFRAWLFRIARNAVLDTLRTRQRLEVEDPAQLDIRRDAEAAEKASATLSWLSESDVAFLVERLPEAQREVLVLRYMLDLSTDQTAAVMDRSTKAVRQLQSRALRTLEQRLTALGRRSRTTRRAPMLVRLRPHPVLAARRFVLR